MKGRVDLVFWTIFFLFFIFLADWLDQCTPSVVHIQSGWEEVVRVVVWREKIRVWGDTGGVQQEPRPEQRRRRGQINVFPSPGQRGPLSLCQTLQLVTL